MEKPEQLMLLPQYMESWQGALDRQKEREEAEDHEEAEDEEEVQSEDASQDEIKSKDEEMEVDGEKESENGLDNGHETNTGSQGNIENGDNTAMLKHFVFCKGFTDEDCDVEEYFEENHENVEQVMLNNWNNILTH